MAMKTLNEVMHQRGEGVWMVFHRKDTAPTGLGEPK